MPYETKKTKSGKTRVINKDTGRVTAKGTTAEKARRQENLLRAVEHGWKPTGAPARDFKKKVRKNVMG